MGKWDWVPLGSVIKIDKNSVLPTDFAQDVYYVGLEDIEKETGRILSTIKIASDVGLKSNKFEFTNQHVLYGKLRPNLNKVALPDFNGVCSTDIYPILPITSRIDRRFLCAVLRSTLFVDYVSNKVNGVNLPRVNEKIISDFRIPLPPLPIQQKIAAVLDKASALIEMRKAQLEKLDMLSKSQFIEMFGDPVTNPKGWETKRLIDVSRKIGSGATPTGGRNSYIDAGISLIRSMNVHNGEFRYDQLAHIDDEQAKQLDNVNVEIHDVLLNITGASVARCCVVPDNVLPARVNQHVSIIRTGNVLNYIYLNNLLTNESFQEHLLRIGSYGGATREALTKKDIEELVIPIPPEHLQKKYADLVSNIIVEKSRLRESLDMFDNKYKSLMQKCFSGEMF